MRRLLAALLSVVLAASCATLQKNPAESEVQKTRKLAVKIFTAVEAAGVGVQGVQQFEITLHDNRKITDEAHRAFQSDLLITARIVRSGLTQIQAATAVPELKNTVQVIIDNLTDLKNRYAMTMPDLSSVLTIVISGLTVVAVMLGV